MEREHERGERGKKSSEKKKINDAFFLKISNKLPIVVPPPPSIVFPRAGNRYGGGGGALREDFTENLRFSFFFFFFFPFRVLFFFFFSLPKKLTLYSLLFFFFSDSQNSTSSADRDTPEATRAEAAEAEAEATTATRDRGTRQEREFFSFHTQPLSRSSLFLFSIVQLHPNKHKHTVLLSNELFHFPPSFNPLFFYGSEHLEIRGRRRKLKTTTKVSLLFFVYSLYLYLEVTRRFSPTELGIITSKYLSSRY